MKYTTPENNTLWSFEVYPEEWHDKLAGYCFETYSDDSFWSPSKYFYTNAFGDKVFFLTRKRKTAQQWLDEIEEPGKYRLRTIVRASVC